ncbi:MAG TPA: CDP-alcohol phosphatidyltransferase family protein [Allosphingosinicella sp.]|nr:CDP-alcohol phosphatidyltransferase family protein [Allosphingosinicella sp.]
MTAIVPVGSNPTLLWGLTAEERLSRIARAQGLEVRDDGGLLVNLGFAFDPSWLKLAASRPGLVVTRGGVPVLAHIVGDGEDVRRAMEREETLLPGGGRGPAARSDGLDPGLRRETLAWESAGDLENEELRKKERPFMERLAPETVRSLERASYFGAYKGVTDLLTKYLWPEWALVLTRWAARIGMTPNQVSLAGAALCLLATWLFHEGYYWPGLAAGLVFMVLDTVDGKLARCTITSSRIGEAIDHGIDLVHPPFWWWAWGVGLHAYGRPLEPDLFWSTLAIIVGGYAVQRLVEGAFILRFGMHIHVWRRFDSRFRLVTARRNPNMVILLVSLIAGRPDWGLVAVAAWTAASLAVHLIQLAQAMAARAAGRPVVSWLA